MSHGNQTNVRIWIFLSPVVFCFAGLASAVVTDLVFHSSPLSTGFLHSLSLSKEPLFLLSSSIPPALFAFFATYMWLVKGVQFFRGWLSVAAAAWFSLVINPIVWFLVMATFALYGFVALGVFFFAGVVLHIAWKLNVVLRSRENRKQIDLAT